MKNLILVVLSGLLLGACSTHQKIDNSATDLESRVDTLSSDIDKLNEKSGIPDTPNSNTQDANSASKLYDEYLNKRQ